MLHKLDQLLGQDLTRAQIYQDFVERYQADPTQLSDAEVSQHYAELANHLDEQDMDAAHEKAFGQMPEDERRALAQRYQYASRDPMRPFQGYTGGTHFNQMMQPRRLGRMTRYAAQHDPELLAELVGPDSTLNSTGAKLAMAGTAAALVGQYLRKH